MGKVCYNYCRKEAGVGVLKTLVTAIGAGLGAWGVINLMEGYGNDNPGAKSQGISNLWQNKDGITQQILYNKALNQCKIELNQYLCYN